MSEEREAKGEKIFKVRLRAFRYDFTPEDATQVLLDEEVIIFVRESALVEYQFGLFGEYAILAITPFTPCVA